MLVTMTSELLDSYLILRYPDGRERYNEDFLDPGAERRSAAA
jgi:hypothetical protein